MGEEDVLAVPVNQRPTPGPADDIGQQRAAHRSGDGDRDHQAEIEMALRTPDDSATRQRSTEPEGDF